MINSQLSIVNRQWLLVILMIISLSSCQTIPADKQLIPVDPSSIQTNRTTLICEFSGISCVNCPDAAEEAHRLLGMWPNNLVVVEIHPPSNPFCQTKKEIYDYTCPAADIYYKHFGGTPSTGFPTGIINLTGEFTPYALWSGAFIASSVEQSNVTISAETAYAEEERHLSADVTLRNLDQTSQELRVIAWLTEDSIVGAQKMQDGKTRTDYVHNHLLRDTLTQVWGEPVQLSSEHTLHIDYTVPNKYVAEHCRLVLLASREDEVVQALQVPIK